MYAVWVTFSNGVYDECQIVATFDKKEDAEVFRNKAQEFESEHGEEWEVDDYTPSPDPHNITYELWATTIRHPPRSLEG